MDKDYEIILAFKKGIDEKHEKEMLTTKQYEDALANVKAMKKGYELAKKFDAKDIWDMRESEDFVSLSLTEKQYLAAKTQNMTYPAYRELMDDLYGDKDYVEILDPSMR